MRSDTAKLLISTYGEAFYVFDERGFVKNIDTVANSFRKYYPNFRIAYSFKTNYVPRLCEIALEKGLMAEVVSEMEYDLAMRIGYHPRDIIYNGPVKSKDGLIRAFRNGSIVHFDSAEEIKILKNFLSSDSRSIIRCGVRLNLDLPGEVDSRFGFHASDRTLKSTMALLLSHRQIEFMGFHSHYQTKAKSPEGFAQRTQMMIDYSRSHGKDGVGSYIDIGGGFYGAVPGEIRNLFQITIPSIDDYVSSISRVMNGAYPKQTGTILIEPGTMLVADVFRFYCTVAALKYINERVYVVANGSIHNIKPMGRSEILPPMNVIQINDRGERLNGANVVGYTCIEDDYLAYDYDGRISTGDLLEFQNVGAYSLMYKPPFIKGQPVILGHADGKYNVIKRKEDIDDIFATYRFTSDA